ncbi:helix-turn-helix domain-containing protein [Peptoniphilus timonensis]|uniref:helix-turn-helix domain-containing protein n=1 Tax=Peptoniphilus timonensis TaxID=1268254 RepID=UPI00031732B9|nr:helix-turn-helix transcriptional regulator [Peptoniphilus timonensis]
MGKIIVDLDIELAKNKMTLTELSEEVGITIANLSILKTNKAKAIRFSTLSEICRVLNCDVGDILRYQGDEDD